VKRKTLYLLLQFILVPILISIACASTPSTLAGTSEPTSTITPAPSATQTLRPSPTPRPTWTPDLAATEHIEQLNAEVQAYYEKGYLTRPDGTLAELEDFRHTWAYLGAYQPLVYIISVTDFFLSAHFEWDSALQNSDTAGCGFIFGRQPNNDHYVVFLDRSKVDFRISSQGYSTRVTPLRGSGQVRFDYPAAADFTLIVNGATAYVLVNGEVVGEYMLEPTRLVRGDLGLTVLSGTNKGYGTRCEMTDLRLWIPNE
jgi:hypothetical protein